MPRNFCRRPLQRLPPSRLNFPGHSSRIPTATHLKADRQNTTSICTCPDIPLTSPRMARIWPIYRLICGKYTPHIGVLPKTHCRRFPGTTNYWARIKLNTAPRPKNRLRTSSKNGRRWRTLQKHTRQPYTFLCRICTPSKSGIT